jgi:hypothetical protein
MSHALLELRGVILLERGEPITPAIDLVTTGERVGLRDRCTSLFGALTGELTVGVGEFLVEGIPLARARAEGIVALGCPLPGGAKSTVYEGLLLDARLYGYGLGDARRLVTRSLQELGLEKWARRCLGRGCGFDHYLAGLVHAQLFGAPVVAVKWPLGVFGADLWARYGAVLSRVLTGRRWIVALDRPIRLAVEEAWYNTLDETVFWSERGPSAIPLDACVARMWLVVHAGGEAQKLWLDELIRLALPIRPMPGILPAADGLSSAWLVDCPRDERGLPMTNTLLGCCDRHQVAVTRLCPLDGWPARGKPQRAMTPCCETSL